MTTPYSSTLLQQTVETERATPSHGAPTQPQRSVTHVVAQPAPMPVAPPQPQVVYVQPKSGGGAVAAVVLGLVVILLGAIALVGGYVITRDSSPSAEEAALVSNIAARDAFRAGVTRATAAGREDAVQNAATTTSLRASIARSEAYAAAFRRGEKAGRSSYRAPRYSGYSGYRGPRYNGYGNGYQVAQAFGQAQNLANLTGAPVDVEIY